LYTSTSAVTISPGAALPVGIILMPNWAFAIKAVNNIIKRAPKKRLAVFLKVDILIMGTRFFIGYNLMLQKCWHSMGPTRTI
jgi:hypothetical protein